MQIRVIRGDLSEATYPGPYCLTVTKFDIIDENEDGINEPGEHLLVHNIKIRNTGGMPSPDLRSIHILIQGTQWLDPIISEPIELPRSIQPGQEVEVPGVLRAYIRNEWAERPLGMMLKAIESVRLVAFFNERLNRPIPNFSGESRIFIQYPLVLDAPTYLDCVAKGDKVRFKWVLHNNSSKSYGIEGLLCRAAATKLSDPSRFFNLTFATTDNPGEATDELSEIESQSMVTIDQDFFVDKDTMEYSEGNLSLELMLSDPKSGVMRSVQKHVMHMQISGIYQLSPNPTFLLVVNSKTPNYAIHQIIHLVRNRLHTSLDIFNLSLIGSYESPVTKRNVLQSYSGKSAIIAGNRFPYFSHGDRNPWDLLDPWEAGLLMKGGTNVLFVSVNDIQGLKHWAEKATFPVYAFNTTSQSLNGQDAKSLAVALKKTDGKELSSDMTVHRFPISKSLFSTVQSSMDSGAKSAAKKMNQNMPLRRFMACPDTSADPTGKSGGVVVCEGIPKTANLLASVDPFSVGPAGSHLIADHYAFLIVACIPFSSRVSIFWNIAGSATGATTPTEVAYAGLKGFCTNPAAIDKKVRHMFYIDNRPSH